MKIQSSGKIDKLYRKSDNKIKTAFKERVRLFAQDPFHPRLHNHPLKGGYRGYRSINVTGDWRALFTEHRGEGGEMLVRFEVSAHIRCYINNL